MNPRIPHHKLVKVARASIIQYLRVKYPLPFFVCYVHPVTQQYKSRVCNQSSHYEKYDGTAHPSYRLKLNYPLLFSISYVRLVTQQYESKSV